MFMNIDFHVENYYPKPSYSYTLSS